MSIKLHVFNFVLLMIFSLLLSCERQSGRRNTKGFTQNYHVEQPGLETSNLKGKTSVNMRKEGGVYLVPIEVNGVPMEFIFDTGASIISISAAEAIFLYKQNKLTDDDFLGTQQFIDATGNVSEGTVILLKTVRIGNKTLTNVQASIVHNLEAPLLLGQSALSRFGTISIDYNRNEIILGE